MLLLDILKLSYLIILINQKVCLLGHGSKSNVSSIALKSSSAVWIFR